MQYLLVDAGNSAIKYATLSARVLSDTSAFLYPDKASAIDFLNTLFAQNEKEVDEVVLVSVLGDTFNKAIQQLAAEYALSFRLIRSERKLALIKNGYTDYQKLGADRFVAMIGAYHWCNAGKAQKKPCIIIDAGTATTIDGLDEKGHHRGGLILPSVNLCQSSLLQNTEQLAQWNDVEKRTTPTLFATNTTEAISSASLLGLAGAIDTICIKMANELSENTQHEHVTKILCGGGLKHLLPYLDETYEIHSHLVMMGLKVIIEGDY